MNPSLLTNVPLESEKSWARNYLVDLLIKLGVEGVELAEKGSGVSIKYKAHDGTSKGLLALALCEKPKKSGEEYGLALPKKTPEPETLIVAANEEKNKFVVIQYQTCLSKGSTKSLTINFMVAKSKYRDYMIEDKKIFCDRLLLMLDGSCVYKGNEEYRKSQKEKCKDATAKGDAAEIFVHGMIEKFSEIEYAERIGQTGQKADIIYKFRDTKKVCSLQVRTMRKVKDSKNDYLLDTKGDYNAKMLIVGINLERDKFAVFFAEEAPSTSLGLSFGSERSKHKDKMFTDCEKFQEALKRRMRDSVIYIKNLNEVQTKEADHLERLKIWCEKNGLNFKRNTTNGDMVDCFIDKCSIQCKTSDFKDCQQYRFNLFVSGGRKNDKIIHVPYPMDSCPDFFIFEIVKHPNQFYIVPKEILEKEGYLSSKNNKGKVNIYVPEPGYKGESRTAWLTEYINRVDLLLKPSEPKKLIGNVRPAESVKPLGKQVPLAPKIFSISMRSLVKIAPPKPVDHTKNTSNVYANSKVIEILRSSHENLITFAPHIYNKIATIPIILECPTSNAQTPVDQLQSLIRCITVKD